MLVLYSFCVATEFLVNKDLYIEAGGGHYSAIKLKHALISNDLVIRFLQPVMSMPQTEKTLSTYAWLGGADITSSVTNDSLS